MNDRDSKEIQLRLTRLEARQRRAHAVAGGAVALLLVAMARPPQEAMAAPDALEVSELRVVHDGAIRIRMGVDADGAASIVLQDPTGTRRVALVAPVGAPARVELFGPDGEPQPLVEQLAAEAGELARDVEEALGAEVDRLRDALESWRNRLLDEEREPPVADATVRSEFALRIVAGQGDERFDLRGEQRRLREWIAGHQQARTDPAAIREFDGASADGVRWFPRVIQPRLGEPGRWQTALSRMPEASAVAAFGEPEWNEGRVPVGQERLIEYLPLRMDGEVFTGADLDRSRIRVGLDAIGKPALTYSMRPERQDAFADWSEANTGRSVAIVVDGVVLNAPRFMGRILGSAQIAGDFTRAEIEELARRLRGSAR